MRNHQNKFIIHTFDVSHNVMESLVLNKIHYRKYISITRVAVISIILMTGYLQYVIFSKVPQNIAMGHFENIRGVINPR